MQSGVWNGWKERPLRRRAGAMLAALAALAAIAAGEASAAADGENRVISDEWVFSVGGYLTDFKTTASAGTSGPVGAVINFEDQLNLEEDKTFARGDGQYRFNERHAIGFGFWSLKRDGRNQIDGSIDWQNVTYPAMAIIDTEFDVSWFRVDWRYSFFHTDRGEAGLNVGISAYDLSASLAGTWTVNMMSQSARGEESVTVPVPTFGMFVNFAITPNVLFRSSFNWLDLDVGDLDGEVTDVTLVFEWYFSEHVGIGGGTARTAIDYKDTSSDPVLIDYKQSGFLGYFTFAWGDVDQ